MRRLGWVVLGVLWLGCKKAPQEAPNAGLVDAGPVEVTEKEPNDRPDQALAVSGNTLVNAGLGADPSKPDEDWYRLAPPSGRSVDLRLTGVPGTDVLLEVFDADRNRLVAVNSAGEGQPERLPNL